MNNTKQLRADDTQRVENKTVPNAVKILIHHTMHTHTHTHTHRLAHIHKKLYAYIPVCCCSSRCNSVLASFLCCQALYQAIHSLESDVAHTSVEEYHRPCYRGLQITMCQVSGNLCFFCFSYHIIINGNR